MLVGFGMPVPQSVALVGGTWLTADGGAALFDGKPARRARIARTGALSVNITLAEAVVPGIVAVLGLNVPAGVIVRAAGATGQTVRLPTGTVCAWLFPTGTAAVSSVAVQIENHGGQRGGGGDRDLPDGGRWDHGWMPEPDHLRPGRMWQKDAISTVFDARRG